MVSNVRPSYPGYAKSYGVRVAYQRFLWNSLFARVHASSFLQDYHLDSADKRLQEGYQLMLQFRLGYNHEFPFLGRRFYIEPTACCNYWPVNTNVPASFKEAEDRYTNYAFEPGLNFGIRF